MSLCKIALSDLFSLKNNEGFALVFEQQATSGSRKQVQKSSALPDNWEKIILNFLINGFILLLIGTTIFFC